MHLNSAPLINERAFISLIPLPETSPHDHMIEPLIEKNESKLIDFKRAKKKEGTILKSSKSLKNLEV